MALDFAILFRFMIFSTPIGRVLIFTIMTFFYNNYETIWVYNIIVKGRDSKGA